MKVTVDWLRKYIHFDDTLDQLAYKLTMAGLEVESSKQLSYNFQGVIIGQIENIQRHESQSHLSICEVNIGKDKIRVICGAPNVAEKLKVPVALEGASLPDGHDIRRETIHGYDSPGMICSEKELGISNRAEIIMELPSNSPIGEDLKTYLKDPETVIEINVTPNRPDCLGVIGIARELSAINGVPYRKPEVRVTELADKKITDFVRVIIENPENCPRYSARYIEGVEIGPSPFWLAQKLEAVGIRSINNVVDVTNYVMMETGQPLHAFDYDVISDGTIIVKNAREGQRFTTLDETERILTHENLMICDPQKSVALAGIMGGLNSEISGKTTRILLESAYFNPTNIRKSSKLTGISSDSSQRFERGVDPNGIIDALHRAAQLIIEVAGGKAAQGYIDQYAREIQPRQISLTTEKLNRVLGADLSTVTIQRILKSLELTSRKKGNGVEVTVPTFRPDIQKDEDLIEEIARIYGYNNFQENLYSKVGLLTQMNKIEVFEQKLRNTAVELGYCETLTNTFVRPEVTAPFSSHPVVELKNPLSEDLSGLRSSLIPSLLLVLQWNINRKNNDLKLFEIGNVFHWIEKGSKHSERTKIALTISGLSTVTNWLEKPRQITFFDLKGDVEAFLRRSGIRDFRFIESKEPFADHRSLGIEVSGTGIGFLGAIRKDILKKFDIDEEVFTAQLDFQDLLAAVDWDRKFKAISKFPSINRDLSIIIAEDIAVDSVSEEIWKLSHPILKSLKLFDLYKGEQIEKGKKSLTFSLTFFSAERTLTEKEVDQDMNEIVQGLKNNIQAQLRA